MAPTYKIIYFDVQALGECIRYLLSYGGAEFEDERFVSDDWPKYKKDMPFGQVPILEVNGKKAHQSVAITRYLAKQFKLTGKDDWENMEIDAIVDTLVDFRNKIGQFYYETDKALKAKLKEVFMKETLPYYVEKFEAIAKANNGHLAVGKLTWADFHFASLVNMYNHYTGIDVLAGRENLQAVKNNVENLPAVKAWIAKRPKSDF